MNDYERIAFQLSDPVSINWTTSEFKNNVKTVMEHITWLLGEMEHIEARMGARWVNAPPEDLESDESSSNESRTGFGSSELAGQSEIRQELT